MVLFGLPVLAQNCNPQIHIDDLKHLTYKYDGEIVIKSFPIDFRNGQRKKITYQFNCKAKSRWHLLYDNKDQGNRGIIVIIRKVLSNGLKTPFTVIDELDNYVGPTMLEIDEASNYEIEFSFNPKYIVSYCAGAVLFMYMKK